LTPEEFYEMLSNTDKRILAYIDSFYLVTQEDIDNLYKKA